MLNSTINVSQKIFDATIRSGFSNCGIISPEEIRDYDKKIAERIQKKIPLSAQFYEQFKNFAHVTENFS